MPLPESPGEQIAADRGSSTEMSLRLCSRAPRTMRWSCPDGRNGESSGGATRVVARRALDNPERPRRQPLADARRTASRRDDDVQRPLTGRMRGDKDARYSGGSAAAVTRPSRPGCRQPGWPRCAPGSRTRRRRASGCPGDPGLAPGREGGPHVGVEGVHDDVVGRRRASASPACAAASASRSTSSARAVISWTLSTDRIWPGIFFSMLWHWSSMKATPDSTPSPPPRTTSDRIRNSWNGSAAPTMRS